MRSAVCAAAFLMMCGAASGQTLYDSFADGNFTASPVWGGNTTLWTIVANSDVAAGATGSNTLRLNGPATSQTDYLSSQVSDWGSAQEWEFWIGRRGQTASAANQSYFWLYANEATLNNATVDGYRIAFGDDTGNDEIRLEYIVNGALSATVITSTGAVTNAVTDIGFLVRVTRSSTGVWALFTSTLPTTTGTGAIATDVPSPTTATVSQGSATHNTLPPAANGYLGVAALHSTGATAIIGLELDQIYFSAISTPTTTSISPTSATAGGSGFTLTVNGTNFVTGLSTVTWNGANRTTTFVNSAQLTASISAGDIASAGTATVGVTTTGASASSNTQTFTINAATTPTVAISAAHPAAGSINQNSTNNIIGSIQLDVTTASASLTGVTVTTAGTYQTSDIQTNGFKFWINSSNNLTGATQLGSAQAVVASGNNIAVSGLSQSIPQDTTRYILVTTDIAYNAVAGRTISLGSTTFSNITFSSANKTGTDPVGASNAQTIASVTSSIAISQLGPSAGNVNKGSTKNNIYQLSFAPTSNATDFTALTVTTAGTYVVGDITATTFKLWYNTTNSLGTATQLGSSQAVVASGNTVSFSAFSQKIDAGATGFVWVTVDIASSATTNATINIAATPFSNISFSQGTKTGTDPAAAGGTQTIVDTSLNTDFFRSAATGDWSSTATWESSHDNSNWFPATLTPDNNANTVTVRSGHTVTVTASVTVDQVVVANGGNLTHSSGTLTVNNGSGDDITVQSSGVFVLNNTNTPPSFNASSTANINTGGILRVTAGGLTGNGTGVNATNFVYQDASILEWATSAVTFSASGVTYFPNVNTSTIPIFRIASSPLASAGGGSNTVINGVFEVSTGVSVGWTGAGTKTFRNGIRGAGDVSQSTAGQFIISGGTAELGGAGVLTLGTNGLQINSGSITTLSSNKTVNSGTLTVAGTLDCGTFLISGTSSTVAVGATGTLKIGAADLASNVSTALTLNATSTVDYNATGAQTIAAVNYGNLTISSARTGSNNVTLASSGTIGVAGAFNPSATFATGGFVVTGSTIAFNGTGSQTIPVFGYNNLTYSGSSTGTFNGNTTVGGDFSQSSGTVNVQNSTSLTRTITISGNFSLSGSSSIFQLINATSQLNTTVNVAGNAAVSGTGSVSLESTASTAGVAIFAVNGNFTATSTSSAIVDFGADSLTGNEFRIGGNFSKSGTGTFFTLSSSPSTGFVFNGAGTQTFSYSGNTSQYTQYVVNSGSTLQMLTGLTLGSATNPRSTFAVNGTLDVGTQVIASSNADPTFTLNSGASLKTANATGLAGSITVTGTKTFSSGANYTYNGSVNQAVGTVTYTPTANTVANLTIGNTGGGGSNTVTLGTPLTATSTLTLTSGLLATTTTNTLTLSNTATTAVVGGSTTSFVNGPLNWTLPSGLSSSSSVYAFPVGSGTTYLPMSLTTITTGGTGPVFQVQANASNAAGSPDNTTVTSLSTTEFWSNKVVSGIFTNGVISLTRQTAVAPFTLIAKSTTQGGTYSSIGGTASGNSINTSSLVGAITAGNSQFYVFGALATISVTGSPTAFSTTYGTVSTAQTLSVSGSTLIADITATAPAGYEVSSDGSTYGSTATFTQTGGSASGTLSIRIAALTAPSTTLGTNLAFTSTSATTQNVTVSGTVNPFTPTVTITGTLSFTYTGSPQGPSTSTVTGVSGGLTPTGAVTYSYVGTGGTTYGPSATKPTNAGSYSVTGSYPGDANYNPALSSATAFTIAKANQTITFGAIPDKTLGAPPFNLTATGGGSGNAVSFVSDTPSVASVSGNTVTIHTTGSTVITASQAGDSNYNPATDVPQTFTVRLEGPIAVDDPGITRPSGRAQIRIAKETLLANDSRRDSGGNPHTDMLSITGVAPGLGNSVSESGAFVFFTATNPAGTGPLTFTYTLTDAASGLTDTAIVTVTPTAPGPFTMNIFEAGTATYDMGMNQTSITVGFISAPSQSLTVEYSSPGMSSFTTAGVQGNPVSTGDGSFQVTIILSGHHEDDWNTAIFFQGTRQ